MAEESRNDQSQANGGQDEGVSQDRVAELETKAADLERQLVASQQEIEKRGIELRSLNEQVVASAAKYRGLLLAGSPEIPQELVSGKTIAEVEASFQGAKDMVSRIRRQIEAKLAAERVPPGAPARSAPDLSQLSPREKIAQGLAQR